jgi:hypothetical protein
VIEHDTRDVVDDETHDLVEHETHDVIPLAPEAHARRQSSRPAIRQMRGTDRRLVWRTAASRIASVFRSPSVILPSSACRTRLSATSGML